MHTVLRTKYIYTYEVHLYLIRTHYKCELRRYENTTPAPTPVMFR
jgi:hypothetical protein